MDFFSSSYGSARGIFLFASYFSANSDESGKGGAEELPEVTFFVPYPEYDTIVNRLKDRVTIRERMCCLRCIRGLIQHGQRICVGPASRCFSLSTGSIFGRYIACDSRQKGSDLAGVLWLIFWLGTLGPFLKTWALKRIQQMSLCWEIMSFDFHTLGCFNISPECLECLHHIGWHRWSLSAR